MVLGKKYENNKKGSRNKLQKIVFKNTTGIRALFMKDTFFKASFTPMKIAERKTSINHIKY